PDEVQEGLTDSRVDALERAFLVNLSALDILEVRIWNRDGRVIFAGDRAAIGTVQDGSANLRRALDGRAVAVISDVGAATDPFLRRQAVVLGSSSPLRCGPGPSVPAEGVIAVMLPYEPVAAAINGDTRRLYAVLAVALAVLWAVLFRFVASASAVLRRQS